MGKYIIMVYFQLTFFELGLSLCNLFQVAEDSDIEKKPDASIYLRCCRAIHLILLPNILQFFINDEKNSMFVGAIPDRPEFGYFGYLEKDDAYAS